MYRSIALALIAACVAGPVPAAGPSAALSGVVLDSGTDAPLEGARLLVRTSGTDPVRTSEPAGADGVVELDGLHAGTYRVAIATAEGALYVSPGTISLADGERREVAVAVRPSPLAPAGVFDKPGTTALVLIGIAVVAGIVLNEIFGSNSSQSPPVSPSTAE